MIPVKILVRLLLRSCCKDLYKILIKSYNRLNEDSSRFFDQGQKKKLKIYSLPTSWTTCSSRVKPSSVGCLKPFNSCSITISRKWPIICSSSPVLDATLKFCWITCCRNASTDDAVEATRLVNNSLRATKSVSQATCTIFYKYKEIIIKRIHWLKDIRYLPK